MNHDSALTACLVHLPLTYNPNEEGERLSIEGKLFRATMSEIALRFGGATFFPEPQVGFWADRGVLFEDTISLLEVDLDDTSENRATIIRYVRNVLLPRFEQRAIRLTFVKLDAVNVTLTIVADSTGTKTYGEASHAGDEVH